MWTYDNRNSIMSGDITNINTAVDVASSNVVGVTNSDMVVDEGNINVEVIVTNRSVVVDVGSTKEW